MMRNSEQGSERVNELNFDDLTQILKIYGEEPLAAEIARGIIDYRTVSGKISTTKQLAQIVEQIVEHSCSFTFANNRNRDKIGRYSHPATKTFQALRIFVNDELNELANGLDVAHKILNPLGRCLVISFHSLEDRLVKRVFQGAHLKAPTGENGDAFLKKLQRSKEPFSERQMASIVTRKWQPVNLNAINSNNFDKKSKSMNHSFLCPQIEEIEINPRSRSAKLRVAEKIN